MYYLIKFVGATWLGCSDEFPAGLQWDGWLRLLSPGSLPACLPMIAVSLPGSLKWLLAGDRSSSQHGPLYKAAPDMPAAFSWSEGPERDYDRNCSISCSLSDIQLLLTHFVCLHKPTVVECGRQLCKGVNTKLEIIGTILEAGYHGLQWQISPVYSYHFFFLS